jgi:hypothetical protein
LVALLSISVPFEPAVQGPADASGNRVPAPMVTNFAVPIDVPSKPQSCARFTATVVE